MKCKYCEREIPNKNFLTDKGRKCKWCDVDYNRKKEIENG